LFIIDGIEITVKIFASLFLRCWCWDTRRRNEFSVAAKILRVAAKGSKEEEIMEQCRLDSQVLENYLSALAELRLLMVENKDETFYRTTEEGLEFLRIYYRLRWLLWGRDNDFLLMRLLGQLRKKVHPFYVS